jgi:hypothetical protein
VHRAAISASVSVAVVVGVIAGGVAAMWISPSDAFASSSTCFNQDHFYTNAHETTNSHHRGTRTHSAGMLVENETPVCDHVSSIVSYSSNNEWVEVGWDDQASDAGTYSLGDCTWNGNDTPTAFKAWVDLQDIFHCRHFQTLTPNTWDAFAVYNQNGNGCWNSSINGSALGGAECLGWYASSSVTNGERAGPGESADAAFTGLEYMGRDGLWHEWQNEACGGLGENNDPRWNNLLFQPDAVDVLAEPSMC